MKKILSLFLVLVMVLGLCACGESGAKENAKQLKVGFGKVDITPDYPVAISGSATERVSTNIRGNIYFTCSVITG